MKFLTTLFLGSFLGWSAYAAAPQYVAVDLGTLGGNSSQATGINNLGQVVGISNLTTNGSYNGFVYSNGAMTDLGSGNPYAVNDAGTIVGQGFIYQNGIKTILPTLSGLPTFLQAVNNLDQATGWYLVNGVTGQAISYQNGATNNLSSLGGTNSFGFGINDSGQISGWAEDVNGKAHAVIYSNGTTADLGFGKGFGINGAGAVVGSYEFDVNGNTVKHAALFTNGGRTDLGAFAGKDSIAYAVNSVGQILGNSEIPGVNGFGDPFLYSEGTMYRLQDLINPGLGIVSLTPSSQSKELNDFGQIAVSAQLSSGQTHTLLLNPVTPLSSTNGSSRNTKFVAGTAFSKFTSQVSADGFGTSVDFLDGIAGANRDVTTMTDGTPQAGFASDRVTVTGTFNDTFVIQVSYDRGAAFLISGSETDMRLLWLDPSDGEWKNAVLGNNGGTALFAGVGAYNSLSNFSLGTYGIDTTNKTVWAVINHNSEFAVSAVPEPSTWALLGMGVLGFVFRRRR